MSLLVQSAALAALPQGFMKAGFGEQDFHNTTVLHPLGLAALAVLAVVTVSAPRRYAVVPFLVMAACISPAQRVVLAGLDFHFLRLLTLAGWLRLVARSEYRGFRWQKLDTLVVAWAIMSTIAQLAREGTAAVLIFRIGRMYDIVGMYVFFRCTVRTWRDLEIAVRALALLILPVAVAFASEKATGRNPFSIFGGVPEFTSIRYDKLRCQGPFPHPILAGCYFAAWLPLLLTLVWYGGTRFRAVLAATAVTTIVFATSSSTPATGYLAAFAFVLAWPLRRSMAALRWGTVTALVGLHMVMKAPVWHLISRISLSKGSTSYHRFLLIDNAIHRYPEWALFGVNSTRHWGHAQYDVTNQFVLEAVTGGTLTLLLFVAILVVSFRLVGRTWRLERNRSRRRMAWALGASLAVQCVMFIGVSISHSQQNLMVFFFVLAATGSLHQHVARQAAAARAQRVAEAPHAVGAPGAPAGRSGREHRGRLGPSPAPA
ncbi:MAG: hypothetical protein AAGB93_04305 [Planctomycetota bacterium]